MIDITTQRVGKTTILALNGRMDSASKSDLMAVIERELAREGHTIALDLSQVNYISTSGLKILRALQENSEQVHIINMSDRVSEVLQITGLDQLYRHYDTTMQAIDAIAPVVDAYTHLELGWLDSLRPNAAGMTFMDWVTDVFVPARRMLGDAKDKVYKTAVLNAIDRLRANGTTVIHDITNSGMSIEPLFNSGLRGVVYVEVLGPNQEIAQKRLEHARRLIDTWRPQEKPGGMRIGIAVHSPYTVIADVWHDALDYVHDENLPLCVHAAESPAEYEFFTKGTGKMADYNAQLGNEVTSPGMTPIAYLEEIGALDLRPLIAHAVQITDDDVKIILANECAVVHCPRSNLRLHCGRMPLEKLVAAGIPVHLGTDSLANSPSLNVLDEVDTAIALHYGKVAPEKIVAMAHRPPAQSSPPTVPYIPPPSPLA